MKKLLIYVALILSLLIFATSVTAQDMSNIERDAKALELYLKDQEDYKKHCSRIKWDQPEIDIYKEKLESQLPESCKK